MKPNTVRKVRQRAVVLVGMMMLMLLLLAVVLIGLVGSSSSGLTDSTTGSLRLTRMRNNTYQAQTLADTGVRTVMQWLNVQSGAPTNMTPFRPSEVSTFWTGSSQNGNYDEVTFTDSSGATIGTFDVRIFPFSDNDTVIMRSYLVESVGTYQGQTQVVRAAIIQDTFAKYAFFSDYASTGTFWTAGATAFNGPVHVNARNMVQGSPDYNPKAAINILWKNTANNVIFRYNGDGAFTTSATNSQVSWYKNNRSTLAGPTSSSDWSRVFTAGQSGYKTGVPMVDMPSQSSRQQDAALGTPPATIPTGPGVTIPKVGSNTSGGIYINGNVDNMQLSASGTNSTVQGITVFQNDGTKLIKTVISIDPNVGTTGQTTVHRYQTTSMTSTTYTEVTTGGYPVTLNGRSNGVVYVNGNVGKPSVPPLNADGTPNNDGVPLSFASGGLSGVVANSLMSGTTVKTSNDLDIVTASDKDLNISGDIIYATVSGANAATSSGILGIVSRKVQLIENLTDDAKGDGAGNVTVDATVMAYDTFNAEDPLVRNYLSLQAFTLLGGYIAKTPGTFAGIDTNGVAQTGFNVTRNYDSRVASHPPPFFPSTGNQYKIRSYQRVAATL